MINMGKHASLDTPPNLPYFCGKAHAQQKISDASSTSSSDQPQPQVSESTTLSPRKRIQLRTECINQLGTWHTLLEKGGISREQYDQLQKEILGGIFDNLQH